MGTTDLYQIGQNRRQQPELVMTSQAGAQGPETVGSGAVSGRLWGPGLSVGHTVSTHWGLENCSVVRETI